MKALTTRVITQQQAELLRTGFLLEGVETLGQDLSHLGSFLLEAVNGDESSDIELPEELVTQAKLLAQHVLITELQYNAALLHSGRSVDIDARLTAGVDASSKFGVLRSVL